MSAFLLKVMNSNIHINLLGKKVRDRVTGLEGIVTSISFDLYGCIQAVVHPGLDAAGKITEQLWFDVSRLEVKSEAGVMPPPDFDQGHIASGGKGPAEKPKQMKA